MYENCEHDWYEERGGTRYCAICSRREKTPETLLREAAPDLYEALKPFCDPVNEVGMGGSSDLQQVEIIVSYGELRRARAALQKATGGSDV